MTNQTIVVATGNAHKVEEIAAILSLRLNAEFVALKTLGNFDDPEETGTTFQENALIKARFAYEVTGQAAVADDSGLVVDALDGAPGIYSARYAGEHGNDAKNNEKLLAELCDVPDEKRSARFVSAIAFIDSSGNEFIGMGACEGMIAKNLRGEQGFGYDPLFLPLDTPGKTMAELSSDEKNSISHRYRALLDLLEKIEKHGVRTLLY